MVKTPKPTSLVLLALPSAILLAAALSSQGATRIYTWPWALWVQVALLGPWLWAGYRFACGRPGLRVGWWIALPPLTALVLSVATSAHPHEALEAALPLTAPLIALPHLAAAWQECTSRRRLILIRVLGGGLSLLTIKSLASWLAEAPAEGVVSWFFSARNPHTLGHWNFTGGLALLVLPLTILLATRDRGIARAGWSLATLLAVLQLLSAGSRGAMLGVMAGLAICGAAFAARGSWSRRQLALGVFALVVIAAGAMLANPRLRHAFRDPASLVREGESEQQRLGFILTGIEIVRAHPWTGIGPGTTPYHYTEHRVDRPGSLENSFQLHCGPLQWIVDTGWIGGAAMIFAAAILKLRVWRMRKSLSPESIAALGVAGGYGGLWLTDYQFDVPLIPWVLALALAALLGDRPAEIQPSDTPKALAPRAAGGVCMLIAAVIALALLPAWRARAAFAAAWEAKDASQPDVFIKHLRGATEAAPWHPYYWNHLGRALAGAAGQLPPESAKALRAEARQAWQSSLAVLPAQDYPWLNLGWLALQEDNATEALDRFNRAAAIYPHRTGLWFGVGLARLRVGEPDAAAAAFAREASINPQFLLSPLWHNDSLSAVAPQVIERLGQGLPSDGSAPAVNTSPSLQAIARWWCLGQVDLAALQSAGPFIGAFPQLNDRTLERPAATLPRGLLALREHWRTVAPIPEGAVAENIAEAWIRHVDTNREFAFTRLLRTFPGTATRRIQRFADGILFRQTDGDLLADLSEIPLPALINEIGPVLPVHHREPPSE